jgi:hypothetical protein
LNEWSRASLYKSKSIPRSGVDKLRLEQMMSRAFGHLTPGYIRNRLLVIYDEHRNPGNPWLTADAVRLLKQLLRTEDHGVEFGSGRSTLWFANHLGRLTSIESDKPWYEKVSRLISNARLDSKVDFRRCEDEDNCAGQAASRPSALSSGRSRRCARVKRSRLPRWHLPNTARTKSWFWPTGAAAPWACPSPNCSPSASTRPPPKPSRTGTIGLPMKISSDCLPKSPQTAACGTSSADRELKPR